MLSATGAMIFVVGRVQNLSYTPVEDEDDILGHGRIDMRVTIRKALKGSKRLRVVSVTTVAHTYLREDRDFVLVLAPAEGDAYTLRTASLWEGPQGPKR